MKIIVPLPPGSPPDVLARVGGEEFSVLLPGTDLQGAAHVAETVRAEPWHWCWTPPQPTPEHGRPSIPGETMPPVIVIEADATRIAEVERARRTLERTGVHCVGSVLNRRRNYIPAFIEEML